MPIMNLLTTPTSVLAIITLIAGLIIGWMAREDKPIEMGLLFGMSAGVAVVIALIKGSNLLFILIGDYVIAIFGGLAVGLGLSWLITELLDRFS